ncbi:uncharacterized protein LOC128895436 [Hylaeus anthracinus]|uniref:uncharacterized protein LOC128895436 n=1 Tax=Hylaeus anthracinus TaxID=313031 RepID=UPI0023B93F3A|nr:uncharacterized protein LOC128895436 [Hylaeus anthracinus]
MQRKDDDKIELPIKNKSEIELSGVTPRTYKLSQNLHIQSKLVSPISKENMEYKEHNGNWQYPYQDHLAKYSEKLAQDVEDSKKAFEQLILDNQNKCLLQDLTSARGSIKLHTTGSIKTATVGKSKKVKNEKLSRRGSLSKLDDITALKFKKRRRKLHGSNSKSTVTTKDTNFIGRKDTKKRKQKNGTSNRHVPKSHRISNEVVEIYHNTAAKSGSASVVLSKHSKLDSHMNCNSGLATIKQQTVHVKPTCENNGSNQQNCNTGENNGQDSPRKQCQSRYKAEVKSTNTYIQNCNSEIASAPVHATEKCSLNQCQNSIMQASCCDPMITHSYEMPTLASKLKRVNRSYFGRFNFRNIPFVVGTSVSPSHNLGLNIQQVLSIMKTRQPSVNGITPLLIRKVSRGIRPVSTLMEQMSNRFNKLPQINSQMTNTFIQKENTFTNGSDNLFENENVSLHYEKTQLRNLNLNLNSSIRQYENLQQTAITDDKTTYENFNKEKDTKLEKQSGNTKALKVFSSQQNVKTQMEIPDIQSKTCQGNNFNVIVCNSQMTNHTESSKGIREVLVNLHDQFEELNTKYEKLQAKSEKAKDKASEEEMLNLEKELTAKEDEINAVINLYKEVMTLKHQMKQLQEKNSYVCVSTEVPLGSDKAYSSMPFTLSKSNGTIMQQRLQHRRANSVITPREPTSIRLAGLLRQIQMFQKQLKLTSW